MGSIRRVMAGLFLSGGPAGAMGLIGELKPIYLSRPQPHMEDPTCKLERSPLPPVLALGLSAGAAVAQQEGLVNINVEGNTVQVPISVAAQVWPNVSADVLSQAVTSQEVVCEIDQETAAQHNIEVGMQQSKG